MEITLETPHGAVVFPAGATGSKYRAAIAYAQTPKGDLVFCNVVEVDEKGRFEIGWGLEKAGEHSTEKLVEIAANQILNQKEALGGEELSFESCQIIFQQAPLEALESSFNNFLSLEVTL